MNHMLRAERRSLDDLARRLHVGEVALFDLDRTLIPGSSLARFARAAHHEGLLRPMAIARPLLWDAVFRRRGLGDSGVDQVRQRALTLAAGQSADAMTTIASRVGRELAREVPSSARWLIDRHRDSGHFCAVVSASPHELVEAFADAMRMHRGVGTRVERADGVLTGSLDGEFCYGAGKLSRLANEVGAIDWTRAHAYSDSMSDLPLLEAVGQPVAVNPDAGLRRHALAAGWPVLLLG